MLTAEDLRRASDDDAVFLVIQRLAQATSGFGLDELYEHIMRQNPEVRALWTAFFVDAEVNNGSFNQYFWNVNQGQFAEEAIAGLRLMGCAEHAAVVADAIEMFFREADQLRPYREARTLEAFSESYERTQSGDLDRRWYALPDLYDRMLAFVRANAEAFVIH